MKIHIVSVGEESIVGYERVEIDPGSRSVPLFQFLDNECEYILAGDLLDHINYEDHGKVIDSLVKKLRISGTIVVGGTDIRLFCQHLNNSTIGEEEGCLMIGHKRSMSTFDMTRTKLENLGLKILTLQTNGTHYEYSAKR